jgi:outer membrane biosynthesis protein TonB
MDMSVDPGSGSHTSRSRDSALRRLSLSTRWLIAGSVALTGALSEAAAHAFPGKTVKAGAHGRRAVKHTQSPSQGAASSLAPPTTTPQAAPETHTEAAPEQPAERPAEPAPETSHEAAPEAHSEPAPETAPEVTPEAAPEAAPETVPAVPEGPVVSGGS